MRILAIESSCDETALAILTNGKSSLTLVKNQVYSQVEIHKKYGGVVPEVAARQHVETVIPLLDYNLPNLKNIDYLAVTQGPGLITSLLLGVTAAKTLAMVNNLPLVPVNHIAGHVYANWLSNKKLVKEDKKYFPSLQLIVSGGHTELVLMNNHGKYKLLGQTLDDAVGEAFDKVAKILSLGYPGGPIVSRLAEQGNAQAYDFPRPMLNSGDYNFSFSGLKTAVLYTLEKKKRITKKDINNICASFQAAAVEVLVKKTLKAARQYKVKSIMLSGGVAANAKLRKDLQQAAKQAKLPFFFPELRFTGDNAAMIAAAAYYTIKHQPKKIYQKAKNVLLLKPRANWQLTDKK